MQAQESDICHWQKANIQRDTRYACANNNS